MKTVIFILSFVLAGAVAQRRPPNYSQDEMPDTSFNCQDKVVGGYYADQETDCQMFHVCVKVPGLGLQDYRFLCPNDTTFDQENQICANWYDIDCEASTLFYSDNFDLYRINKGPSSSKGTPIPLGPSTQRPPAALPKKRPTVDQEDDEEEFYLQRAETGDRRLQKDLLRGSSSGNFFNKNRGKDVEEDEEDEVKPIAVKKPTEPQRIVPRRPAPSVDESAPKKKVAVRKLRKRPQNEASSSSTAAQQSYDEEATPTTTDRYVNRQNNRQSSTRAAESQRTQSTSAPSTRAQYQPRYNTISRTAVSQTSSTTTAEPVLSTDAIQAQINSFQSRNSRPRFNAQRNNFQQSTTQQSTTQQSTTQAPPTTRNLYTQQPTNKVNYRGFDKQKSSSVVPSSTVVYQSADSDAAFNKNNNNNNNAAFNNNNNAAFNNNNNNNNNAAFNNNKNNNNNNAAFNNNNNNNNAAFNNNQNNNAALNNNNNNAAFNNQNKENAGAYNGAVGDFSRSTTLGARPTTIAPVTYNGNYKPAQTFSARPTEKPVDYQDYSGGVDSYGNQRGGSDEYVVAGEEEFLKTAPSNNIRPSNFNNFRKTYTSGDVAVKATTNYNYDAKNAGDFAKTTQKSFGGSSTYRSTSQYTTTPAPPKRPSTQYYQPSTVRPAVVSTTAAAPVKYAAAPVKYTAAAVSKKAAEVKASGKVKDYDYAYYDDTEYEGADPISDHHFGVAGESQKISN